MHFKKQTFIVILLGGLLFGDPPVWTVNSHDYEYVMTITAELLVNGTENADSANLIGAFIDEECRGSVYPENVNGTWIYFLMVYGNTPGTDIQFNVYYAEADTVIEQIETLSFMPGDGNGTVDEPFIFTAELQPTETLTVAYILGWQMVGLALNTADAHYLDIFPNAQSGTFYSYDNTYFEADSLEPGAGYLLMFTDEISLTFSGTPIEELVIQLTEGWNLISSISTPVSTADIYATGLIVSGTIFELGDTYSNPDYLEPGKGYWIRSQGDGELILSAGLRK